MMQSRAYGSSELEQQASWTDGGLAVPGYVPELSQAAQSWMGPTRCHLLLSSAGGPSQLHL